MTVDVSAGIAHCVWDGDVGLCDPRLAQRILSSRCHPSRQFQGARQ